MGNEGRLVRRMPSNMLEFVLECITKYTLSEDDIKIADYVFDDIRNPMEVLCLYGEHSMTRLQMHYLSGHSALDLAEVGAAMAFNPPKSLIRKRLSTLTKGLDHYEQVCFIPLMLFAFTILHDI
ncbi:hypothetical protein AAG906_036899 [Vitis piasezkii]